MTLEDLIVNAIIKVYNNLPKTGKCKAEEWTVISAIVGVFDSNKIQVLSLGTGSKCIGQSSMSPKGDILNDSHAEVIARRAFVKYLLLEIIKLNETDSSDIFCRENSESVQVCLKGSVKFYFVTSMVPCGDASIMPKGSSEVADLELLGECLTNSTTNSNLKRAGSTDEDLNSKKMKTNGTPDVSRCYNLDIHRTGAKCLPDSAIQDPHLPGVLYHNTGALRTKPGRGDPTLSLSCSDKIARWNAVGWQGALLSFFISSPLLIEGIICGGNTPFSKDSFNRAVNNRIGKNPPVNIQQSSVPFPEIKAEGKRPNPSSLIWCRLSEKVEVSVNGRKLGVTKKNFDKKVARTSICKKELYILFEKAVGSFKNHQKFLEDVLGVSSLMSLRGVEYRDLKLKAKEYQARWEDVKNEHFKLWCNKPKDLLKFKIDD